MKEVTKEQFNEFIENYPNKLDKSILTICEPMQKIYSDFSNCLEGWETIVASITLPYMGEGERYMIKE